MNPAGRTPAERVQIKIVLKEKGGFMKMVKLAVMAGITGAFTSVSIFATPLDITLTGGTPYVMWGTGSVQGNDMQYEDIIPGNGPGQINMAGVNSVQVTWQAPAGYMYAYTPAPADVGQLNLQFEVAYGNGFSPLSSLGSVTSQSLSVNTIYGTSPLAENVSVGTVNPRGALFINASAAVGSGDPFAFSSLTILANFSGTGSGTLDLNPSDQLSGYFGVLYGLPFLDEYSGPSDPGPLLTLVPLPTASTPDTTSTLSLAGLGFAGLLLFGQKRSPIRG